MVEKVLRAIAAFSDLVADLPRPTLFGFEASLLLLLHECLELLLLLPEGGFTGEDARLKLVLVSVNEHTREKPLATGVVSQLEEKGNIYPGSIRPRTNTTTPSSGVKCGENKQGAERTEVKSREWIPCLARD